MKDLSEDMRTALMTQVLGEMTRVEISLALDKPPGTIRCLIRRTRQRLAAKLSASVAKEGGAKP